MATNKQDLDRIRKELEDIRGKERLLRTMIRDFNSFNKISLTDKEQELTDNMRATIAVKHDAHVLSRKKLVEQETVVEELIAKKKKEKLDKKISKLNPKLTYITGKVTANPIGYTPQAIEVLAYKDNKILIWDKGYSSYTTRATGVVYSTSELKIVEAKHMELKDYGYEQHIRYGDHGRYTGSPTAEIIVEGGKMSVKLLNEHIDVIREFFDEPTLEGKDIVRNFLLCLSPVEDMKENYK